MNRNEQIKGMTVKVKNENGRNGLQGHQKKPSPNNK